LLCHLIQLKIVLCLRTPPFFSPLSTWTSSKKLGLEPLALSLNSNKVLPPDDHCSNLEAKTFRTLIPCLLKLRLQQQNRNRTSRNPFQSLGTNSPPGTFRSTGAPTSGGGQPQPSLVISCGVRIPFLFEDCSLVLPVKKRCR
jgi:hypothetical protein